MVGEGGNSQRNEGRCLAMLLVSLVRFMELKDFKGVLWNRPSRCIIKQNRNVLRALAEVSCCNVLLGCQIVLLFCK